MNYSKLAPYYDLLGWADFTFHIWPHIRDFFSKIDSPPARFLDIACGTGVLTSILSDENIHVTGIDICKEMIHVARKKKYSHKPNFIVADMCNFDLGEQFPVTGCFYDSLNHLASEKEVRMAFDCAYRHTESGGYYIFDINTHIGLENWAPYCSQKRNHFIVSQSVTYDDATMTSDIKVEAFVRNRSGKVTHIDQNIREKAYHLSFVQNALAEVGFRKLAFEPFMHEDTVKTAGRLFVICRK